MIPSFLDFWRAKTPEYGTDVRSRYILRISTDADKWRLLLATVEEPSALPVNVLAISRRHTPTREVRQMPSCPEWHVRTWRQANMLSSLWMSLQCKPILCFEVFLKILVYIFNKLKPYYLRKNGRDAEQTRQPRKGPRFESGFKCGIAPALRVMKKVAPQRRSKIESKLWKEFLQ